MNRSDTCVCTDIDGTVRKQFEEDTDKLYRSFPLRTSRFVNEVLIPVLDNLTVTASRGAEGFNIMI